MKLTENTLTTIVYEKLNSEQTSRVIIPTKVPADQITAIDVSDLDLAQRERMQQLYTEYQQYVKGFMSTMFTFSDWADHVHGEAIEPKWRSFKLSGLK